MSTPSGARLAMNPERARARELCFLFPRGEAALNARGRGQWAEHSGSDERGGDGDKGAKSTLAYIQLEKQNERLKEALVRLRDVSQETEQDQRRRIAEMEKDLMTVDDLQGQSTAATERCRARLIILCRAIRDGARQTDEC